MNKLKLSNNNNLQPQGTKVTFTDKLLTFGPGLICIKPKHLFSKITKIKI